MDEIEIFVNRLKKIGIEVILVGNIPWVYLHKVNGNTVTEKLNANHGFTVAWYPVRMGSEPRLNWEYMDEIFDVIRKYR
jgi:hypothetical protein